MSSQNNKTTSEPFSSARPSVSRKSLLLSDSGATFRQFLNDFMHVAKIIETERANFAQFMGMTPSQYSMIMLIAEDTHSGGTTPGSLSKKLQQRNTFVVTQLRQLMKMGIITKRSNPTDKRSTLYELTPKGHEILQNASPLIQIGNDSFFEHISQSEFETLSAAMRKLAETANSSVNKARNIAVRNGYEHQDGKYIPQVGNTEAKGGAGSE